MEGSADRTEILYGDTSTHTCRLHRSTVQIQYRDTRTTDTIFSYESVLMNYLHPVLCVRGDVISEMSMGNDVVILAWGQEDHTMSYVHPPADRSILLSILILCGVCGWVGATL
jgi:hypothetical protein